MRRVVLAAMLLATACGGDTTATTPDDPQDLEAAECAAEEFEAWDVGFDEDAQGAATPESALELHDDQTGQLPTGQPVRLSESSGQVSFAFLDDGEFSGRASVRELDNGWLVEGAIVCY